jgi:hypothetical protein
MQRQYIFRLISRVNIVCIGCCTTPFLAACMQSVRVSDMDSPANSVIVSSGTLPVQTTRVVVTFNRSVPFTSDVLLLEMQHLALARFSYIAPVSGAGHVYGVQPLQGQTIEQVLQRLGNMPVVRSVEVDQRMRINQ